MPGASLCGEGSCLFLGPATDDLCVICFGIGVRSDELGVPDEDIIALDVDEGVLRRQLALL